MMNKFITIADKLDWPVAVQIDGFIKILPMSLRQFVITRPSPDFEAVRETIRVYQDMLETDLLTHSFKNVSFAEDNCTLCGKEHQSLRCPSLKSVIEMETSSKQTYRSRNRSPSPDYRGNNRQSDQRSQSEYRRGNGGNRNRRSCGSQYRGNSNRYDRNDQSRDRCYQNYRRGGASSPFRQYGYSSNNRGYTNNYRGRGFSAGRYQRGQGYQRYNNNFRGRQPWGQYRDQNRQQSENYNNYYTHSANNDSSSNNAQSACGGINSPGLSNMRSFVTNDGVTFNAQQNGQNV